MSTIRNPNAAILEVKNDSSQIQLASPLPLVSNDTSRSLAKLVERLCVPEDLSTFDPYDIWKTGWGLRAKIQYNRTPRLALPAVAALALVDDLWNHRLRRFYGSAEYPIVHAFAALCLLNLYRRNREQRLLAAARRHLRWLIAHSCRGYSGYCWGLGFRWAVSRDLIYDRDTPLSTVTPYVLEAFVQFAQCTADPCFDSVIESIFRFFQYDLHVMEEDAEALATSYGPFHDRIVINALSYNMYSLAISLPYGSFDAQTQARSRIQKLYTYIRRNQQPDGSWFYSPQGRPFIDCFHSCIVLKNIAKTARLIPLDGAEAVAAAGYEYLKKAFVDEKRFLCRRFSIRNKPTLIRFDLYDNAEMLNLALLRGDFDLAEPLLSSVFSHFVRGTDIYSQIDFLGRQRNKNTLRWAVMPFLYAASQIIQPSQRP